jgi:hypothetical protein
LSRLSLNWLEKSASIGLSDTTVDGRTMLLTTSAAGLKHGISSGYTSGQVVNIPAENGAAYI